MSRKASKGLSMSILIGFGGMLAGHYSVFVMHIVKDAPPLWVFLVTPFTFGPLIAIAGWLACEEWHRDKKSTPTAGDKP